MKKKWARMPVQLPLTKMELNHYQEKGNVRVGFYFKSCQTTDVDPRK